MIWKTNQPEKIVNLKTYGVSYDKKFWKSTLFIKISILALIWLFWLIAIFYFQLLWLIKCLTYLTTYNGYMLVSIPHSLQGKRAIGPDGVVWDEDKFSNFDRKRKGFTVSWVDLDQMYNFFVRFKIFWDNWSLLIDQL